MISFSGSKVPKSRKSNFGNSYSVMNKTNQAFLAWSAWGVFSDCSTTCGPGSKTRKRTCKSGPVEEIGGCDGDSEETLQCNIKTCSGTQLNCAGSTETQRFLSFALISLVKFFFMENSLAHAH